MLRYVLPALPALMAAGALAAAIGVIVNRRRLNAAWYRGVTVEGRCLRTYETRTTWRRGLRENTHSTLSHVYEFTTPDGRTLRFEEEGPATVFDGDTVPVRYPQGRPDRATALPPGDRGTRAKFRLKLAFLGFATLLCLGATAVFFVATSFMSDAVDEVDKIRKHEPSLDPTTPAPAPPPPSLPPLPSGPPDDFPTDFPKPPTGWPTDIPDMPKPPGNPPR
ncbi:DUF3592 domain-containing protein [Streptomyces sp. NPDC053048]|uniref:DUF3592 domain-containing protein n=1 Tax=Streptomyces sp. NPDC053048 TaxID=3365694 RepID=UPI0037D18CFE